MLSPHAFTSGVPSEMTPIAMASDANTQTAMIMVADGAHKTAHYAICTGLMALGMMLPGMQSGRIQEYLGYQHFFIWVCVATIPAFVLTALLKIDPAFGKKA